MPFVSFEIVGERVQRSDWVEDATRFDTGPWRYAVLRAGQTIIFPSGTVHAVFRLRDAQHPDLVGQGVDVGGCRTLCPGGHFLQWTRLSQWLDGIMPNLGGCARGISASIRRVYPFTGPELAKKWKELRNLR